MQTNYQDCRAFVRKYEGGFSNIRSDPGNWTGGKVGSGQLKGTKYGIAANSHPHLDIANLTMEQADAIFKTEYWDTIGGDAMPMGVDLVSFDVSVNSGPGKARQWYVDARAASQQPLDQIRTICTRRLSFMHGLRAWSQFGKGWAARVSACEAKAIVMASKALSLHPNTTIQTLGVEAGASKTKATKAAKVAVVSGGGGAVTTADAATAGHTGKVIAFIMIAALVGMCVVLVIKAMQHQQRAEAMDAEAKGVV